VLDPSEKTDAVSYMRMAQPQETWFRREQWLTPRDF